MESVYPVSPGKVSAQRMSTALADGRHATLSAKINNTKLFGLDPAMGWPAQLLTKTRHNVSLGKGSALQMWIVSVGGVHATPLAPRCFRSTSKSLDKAQSVKLQREMKLFALLSRPVTMETKCL